MSGYGTYPAAPVGQLALKEPDAYLDYTASVQAALTDPNTGAPDPLVSLTLAVAPSGAGEMVVSQLSVDHTGLLVTFWLAGGVAGRNYILNLVATTAAGRVYQWLLSVAIDATLASYPPPAPPSPGFGAAVLWPAAG